VPNFGLERRFFYPIRSYVRILRGVIRRIRGDEGKEIIMILYVTAALGLTNISKDSVTGAIVFRPAFAQAEAYTGDLQIIADQGSYVDVDGDIEVIAENGSRLCGYRGSRILARLGASVTAEEGSYVFAEYGSFVTAYDGSRVDAMYGSQIKARFGCYVVAQEGALVDQFCGSTVVDCDGGNISLIGTSVSTTLMGR
jgi:hypothetical protein